jgi:hypothetical protein
MSQTSIFLISHGTTREYNLNKMSGRGGRANRGNKIINGAGAEPECQCAFGFAAKPRCMAMMGAGSRRRAAVAPGAAAARRARVCVKPCTVFCVYTGITRRV